MATKTVGANISVDVTGNKAVITIDLSKRLGDSKSGKTVRVASTEGNKVIPGTEVVLGLNAYVRK